MLRKTKIIATLGPASSDPANIAALVEVGVDVFRVNTSHLNLHEAEELYENITAVRSQFGRSIGVLVDLQGPKQRLGQIETFPVNVGDEYMLVEGKETNESGIIPVAVDGMLERLTPGTTIRLGDGAPEFLVQNVSLYGVTVTCLLAGSIRSRMGIALPAEANRINALTEQDRQHVRQAAQHADFFALSFVGSAKDVIQLRELLEVENSHARIIAKIERQVALTNLHEILDVTDGVMVARGDLGVEIGLSHVPFAQKWIIQSARRKLRCVITATQVLESMIHSEVPTRAEITDLTNAVMDQTSALMLSAETAVGDHPTLVVETMDRLLRVAETYNNESSVRDEKFDDPRASLVRAADQLARGLNVQTIVIPTTSGDTARFAAQLVRPDVIALCPERAIRRQLTIEHRVYPLPWDGNHGDYLPQTVTRWVQEAGLVAGGEHIIIAWGEYHDGTFQQLLAALQVPLGSD